MRDCRCLAAAARHGRPAGLGSADPAGRQDPRQPVDDLVDRHQLRNREIRDPMVDYIRRSAVEVDYGSLDNLVRNLVRYFWKIVEEINSDQADLRLSEEIVQAWKERLLVRQDGKPRQHIDGSFLVVRAFCLDLQTWSASGPERWGRWVAPCAIRDAELRRFHIRRRRLRERMANRTRERQPLLVAVPGPRIRSRYSTALSRQGVERRGWPLRCSVTRLFSRGPRWLRSRPDARGCPAPRRRSAWSAAPE